jgi:hypothetical protein
LDSGAGDEKWLGASITVPQKLWLKRVLLVDMRPRLGQ